jgi:hypothetical protein
LLKLLIKDLEQQALMLQHEVEPSAVGCLVPLKMCHHLMLDSRMLQGIKLRV